MPVSIFCQEKIDWSSLCCGYNIRHHSWETRARPIDKPNQFNRKSSFINDNSASVTLHRKLNMKSVCFMTYVVQPEHDVDLLSSVVTAVRRA